MKKALPKVLLFRIYRCLQSSFINDSEAPKSKMYIFDCFADLIDPIITNDCRWDGIFDGNSLFLNVSCFRNENSLFSMQKKIGDTLPLKDR